MMLGFVSEQESEKLRQCLLDIAESDIPGLYYESEKHLLTRCRERCKAGRPFTELEANRIYAIHCRLPKKIDQVKSPEIANSTPEKAIPAKKQAIIDRAKAVKKASPWMS